MTVTLKFLGALRHASGKNRAMLNLEGETTIMGLVETITEQSPSLRRQLIDEQLEPPSPNALILVNGREISVLNGLATLVKDGDEVIFVPVVHGG